MSLPQGLVLERSELSRVAHLEIDFEDVHRGGGLECLVQARHGIPVGVAGVVLRWSFAGLANAGTPVATTSVTTRSKAANMRFDSLLPCGHATTRP